MKRRAALLLGLTLAGCATPDSRSRPALAITIDDLPVHGPIPPGETPTSVAERLIAGLKKGGADFAMGFVNGRTTVDDPATLEVLERWQRAGLELGNHGWSHRNLNELAPAEFDAELVRNEPPLRRFAAGKNWRWFRFPFLAEGDDPTKREDARQVLARRSYRIAAVTMDFSDWQWTGPYARCVAKGDEAGIARLETLYLQAASSAVARSRQMARAVHGRDIPHVLLLHGGAFTARMIRPLLKLYRDQDFRFVSLAEASRDPAYASDVTPERPGPPATLEGRAAAAGVPIPPAPAIAESLAAICA
nr:polysaccharide deacetylase family protein [uncultured Sphingomonas sp.]